MIYYELIERKQPYNVIYKSYVSTFKQALNIVNEVRIKEPNRLFIITEIEKNSFKCLNKYYIPNLD